MRKISQKERVKQAQNFINKVGLGDSPEQRRETLIAMVHANGNGIDTTAGSATTTSDVFRIAESDEEAKKLNKEKRESAIRGKSFIEGPKKDRPGRRILDSVIEDQFIELRGKLKRNPTNKEVWDALPPKDHPVIQEKIYNVVFKEIHWTNPKTKTEGRMQYNSFRTFLSKLRKKHSP